MNLTFQIETDITPDEFIDVLRRSTLAERRPIDEPETIASMSILGRVAEKTAEYGTPLYVPTSKAMVMSMAQQVVKDPYSFDFLTLHDGARERDLESGLLAHIGEFLLELGLGFAFVGSQVHLEIEQQDFYLDLLFYHLHLRCFVVIDLKIGEFKPEYAGKMNFYLSAVDDQMRHREDRPSIGLLLCRAKDRLIVEYALRDMVKPIGVSTEYVVFDGILWNAAEPGIIFDPRRCCCESGV